MERCRPGFSGFTLICLIPAFFAGQLLTAQPKLDLSNLLAFKNAGANWHIAGDVHADLEKNNTLAFSNGTGVLVNIPIRGAREELYTNLQHGDLDLELDYMMAKGSNSGIYFQSRYEVQLFDSWATLNPHSDDNAGIYERWDDLKPDGQKGYEGHAPRQNASRAPGLWQHIKISFQAPRFQGGTKVSNARILRVELNGVLIHENVELFGPTRSSISNDEVPVAALKFQGDHGPVAFRNIVLTNFDKQRPTLTNISYSVYNGKFQNEPDYKTLKPSLQKTAPIVSSNIDGLPSKEFLVKYTGVLHVSEAGEYSFVLTTAGGGGMLKINNKSILPFTNRRAVGKVNLPAGDMPVELTYAKNIAPPKPSVSLTIKGPGIRDFTITDPNIPLVEEGNAILVNTTETPILRSFMDLPGNTRVTHAVSVSSPEKVHYTYDLDNGMMVQLWRGGFLDATPMWSSRGDGSSKPTGMVLYFGKPILAIEKLNDANTGWLADTAGTAYRPHGYVLDKENRPTFKYSIYGAGVTDAIRVMDNSTGIHREINITNGTSDMYLRLAEGSTIEEISSGFYLVDDKSYYLKIDEAGNTKSFLRDKNGRKELIIPIKNKLSYTILF
jgi:hypothetical protein